MTSRPDQAKARRALRRINSDSQTRDDFIDMTRGMTPAQRDRRAIEYFEQLFQGMIDVTEVERRAARERAERRRREAVDQLVSYDDDINFEPQGPSAQIRIQELLEWMHTNQDAVMNQDIVYIIRSGSNYYTLNRMTYFDLLHALSLDLEEEEPDESDAAIVVAIINTGDFTISRFVPRQMSRNMDPDRNTGSFIPFIHLIDDAEVKATLAKMGVFDEVKAENYETNCLIHSLRGVVSSEVLNEMMTAVRHSTVPRKHLRTIGEKYNILFIVHTDNDSRIRKYGAQSAAQEAELCLFHNHYFPFIKDTGVSGFAIRNYYQLKEKYPQSWKLKKNMAGSASHIGISSMRLMKLLSTSILVKDIEMSDEHIWRTVHMNDISKKFTSLQYPKSSLRLVHEPRGVQEDKRECQRELISIKKHKRMILEREGGEVTVERLEKQIVDKRMGYKEQAALFRSSLIPSATIFFDFESSTEGQHKAYMVAWRVDGEDDVYHREGIDCAETFLEWINFAYEMEEEDFDVTLIAHNVSYDISFMLEFLKPGTLKAIKKGNRFISASGEYKSISLHFKDSYKIIPSPLREFSKMFNLPYEKEIMPYGIYSSEFCEGDFLIHPDKIAEQYGEAYVDSMRTNIERWDCSVSDKWDMLKYAREYCELDVKLLSNGWNKFRQMTLDFFDIDINGREIYTVAGMAYRHLMNECFEDTFSVSGLVLEFIRRSTVGGQTQSAHNRAMIVEGEILDEDKRSLYPSAMVTMPGIPKGKPKIFECEIPSDADYFFVEIVINKIVGPHYAFPILAARNQEGINDWTNDMEGHRIIIGRRTLEDLIEWNDVFDYTVIHGYYWNEGFNTKISSTIEHMYNRRDELKNQKNPAQLIYKLLMNSSYGRTGLKPIDDDDRYLQPDELNRYIANNHNRIVKMNVMPNGDTRVQSRKAINNHFNQQHVASMILEQAKHLMRKVLLLQERLESPLANNIYYTDTDSIHISRKSWMELEKIYFDIYQDQLEGPNLGQFHSDFAISGTYQHDENGKLVPSFIKEKDLLGGNLYSRKLYVCGKKAYMDVLTSDKNLDITLFHFRLKGIPNSSVIQKCDDEYDGDIEQLYKELVHGKKIRFTISGMFKTERDGLIRTISQDREVQFKGIVRSE